MWRAAHPDQALNFGFVARHRKATLAAQPPGMQRLLLQGADQILAVRAEGGVAVKPFPKQLLRLPALFPGPACRPSVMGDGEPLSLGVKGKPAHGAGVLEQGRLWLIAQGLSFQNFSR